MSGSDHGGGDRGTDLFSEKAQPQRQIATKSERDALVALRKKPQHDLTLEPDGAVRRRTDYDAERWRERRIQYLETRLSKASHRLNKDAERAFRHER